MPRSEPNVAISTIFAKPEMNPTPHQEATRLLSHIAILLGTTKTQVLTDEDRANGMASIRRLREMVLRLKGPMEHD